MLNRTLHAAFPNSNLSWYVPAFLLMVASFSLAYVAKIRKNNEQQRQRKEIKRKEKMLYSIASRHEGIVRAIDVASALGFTKAEAENYLLDLSKDSTNQIHVSVSDSGDFVFYFDLIRPLQRVQTNLEPDPQVVEGDEDFLERRYFKA